MTLRDHTGINAGDPTQPNAFETLSSVVIPEWYPRALCAQTDSDSFFPEKGGSAREAKRTCLACDVRVQCLQYALDNDEKFGIWGGLSERERRLLKRRARPTAHPYPQLRRDGEPA